MGLIKATGKKDIETKLIIFLIYFLLIIGGTTMVYPFLIMISGSFKSEVDMYNYDVVPEYFFSNKVLFCKYLESKYNESIGNYNINARQGEFSFEKINPPGKIHHGRISDWQEFLKKVNMPLTHSILGHSYSLRRRLLPEMVRKYRKLMQKETEGSIAEYNKRYSDNAFSWLQVIYPRILIWEPQKRKFKLTGLKIESVALKFKSEQPHYSLYYLSIHGAYVQEFLYFKYGKNIDDYNRAYGMNHQDYSEIFLSRTVPERNKEKEDWLEFVRNHLNLQFIRIKPDAKAEFLKFLEERYDGRISALNRMYGTHFKSFTEVTYPDNVLLAGSRLVDWEQFIYKVSAKYLTLIGPEFLWQDFLKQKYSGIYTLNQVHESNYVSFEKIPMPTKEVDYQDMLTRSGELRWEFASRNYKYAIQYLLTYGRGIWNTFVYCTLAILITLIVNPLAAYAMSRYNLPSTYKILLFLLATMSFPPMVTMIPNFLLLKELGLLNTFWALILPTMVNGYAIFLLKGFFDSLPKELYESAMIDGASEWVMFWKITMFLSKPILAVIALQAFTAAYGAFMFAFIVCQDSKMWTLMVWLYQLQQYSHQSVTFAALIIAAVPTFLVFVLCQNLIMRGIVVPVEK